MIHFTRSREINSKLHSLPRTTKKTETFFRKASLIIIRRVDVRHLFFSSFFFFNYNARRTHVHDRFHFLYTVTRPCARTCRDRRVFSPSPFSHTFSSRFLFPLSFRAANGKSDRKVGQVYVRSPSARLKLSSIINDAQQFDSSFEARNFFPKLQLIERDLRRQRGIYLDTTFLI